MADIMMPVMSYKEIGEKGARYALDEVEYNGLTIRQWADKITSGEYAPAVHGRWYVRGGRACCSNCNVKSLWGSDRDGCKNHEREFVSAKSNYCPNCGAKMDEEAINEAENKPLSKS